VVKADTYLRGEAEAWVRGSRGEGLDFVRSGVASCQGILPTRMVASCNFLNLFQPVFLSVSIVLGRIQKSVRRMA
jgi:hypothetical protein